MVASRQWHTAQLMKVKLHIGIRGNEQADRLASTAAELMAKAGLLIGTWLKATVRTLTTVLAVDKEKVLTGMNKHACRT